MNASLLDLGWTEALQRELAALGDPELIAGRVASQHRRSYDVLTAMGQRRVELGARWMHDSDGPLELPTVGDWVAVRDGHIAARFARASVFIRKAARERNQAQLVAANISTVFIVTAATRPVNPRLIERYVAAVTHGGAQPVLVLNKIDACESLEPLLPLRELMRAGLAVECVSALLGEGDERLRRRIGHGTAALVGMSGTGKTTIVNWLSGRDDLATNSVRAHDDRGKHTTTRRELFVLPGGGVLIDTPGMRELGLWLDAEQLAASFPDVAKLAGNCRFGDCQHGTEPGCSVQRALAAGELSAERFEHFTKLSQELTERAPPRPRPGKRKRR